MATNPIAPISAAPVDATLTSIDQFQHALATLQGSLNSGDVPSAQQLLISLENLQAFSPNALLASQIQAALDSIAGALSSGAAAAAVTSAATLLNNLQHPQPPTTPQPQPQIQDVVTLTSIATASPATSPAAPAPISAAVPEVTLLNSIPISLPDAATQVNTTPADPSLATLGLLSTLSNAPYVQSLEAAADTTIRAKLLPRASTIPGPEAIGRLDLTGQLPPRRKPRQPRPKSPLRSRGSILDVEA